MIKDPTPYIRKANFFKEHATIGQKEAEKIAEGKARLNFKTPPRVSPVKDGNDDASQKGQKSDFLSSKRRIK